MNMTWAWIHGHLLFIEDDTILTLCTTTIDTYHDKTMEILLKSTYLSQI